MTQPKVAIVYDWLDTPVGGAEQVLQALHIAFPDAPLYTSQRIESRTTWLNEWDVRTTWLQLLPEWLRRQRFVMLFSPLAFETLDLHEFEVIISVTSATAKGVLTTPTQLHICYLLTPPRYLYSHRAMYFSSPLSSFIYRYVQASDQVAARRPDLTVPISHLVAARVRESYHFAPAKVMYPPVREITGSEMRQILLPTSPYVLVVSRLVAYKQIDLAIKACAQLGKPLVIIGTGPDESRLRQIAKDGPVIWLGQQPDDVVVTALTDAEALLMPGIEDFGITALEAAAVGTPTIMHTKSGVAEILDAKHAIHITESTVEAVVAAIRNLSSTKMNASQLRQIAQKYGTTSFVRQWQTYVTTEWQHHQANSRKDRHEST